MPSLPGCAAFDRDAAAYIAAHPAIRTVVIGADWFAHEADLGRLDATLAAVAAPGAAVEKALGALNSASGDRNIGDQLSALAGSASTQLTGAAAALGVGTGMRLLIALSWLFVPGKAPKK